MFQQIWNNTYLLAGATFLAVCVIGWLAFSWRSIANMIGIYAAILKELNEPLHYPGTEGGFRVLYQSVDADLLARAITWIVTQPACADNTFNVSNGDYFRWSSLWPMFADYFGMQLGTVKPMRLAQAMADKAAIWDRIVAQHGLQPRPLADAAVWPYADFNFARDYDVMSSTLKLRQTGFSECIDTGDMMIEHLRRFRAQGSLP